MNQLHLDNRFLDKPINTEADEVEISDSIREVLGGGYKVLYKMHVITIRINMCCHYIYKAPHSRFAGRIVSNQVRDRIVKEAEEHWG